VAGDIEHVARAYAQKMKGLGRYPRRKFDCRNEYLKFLAGLDEEARNRAESAYIDEITKVNGG
jgi:hypothetical protein